MSRIRGKTLLPLLGFFCLLPTIQTAVSVHLEWHTSISYPLLKALMVVVPIAVWIRSGKSWPQIRSLVGWKRTNFLPGLGLGLLMSAIILTGYYVFLRPVIDPRPVLAKVSSLNLLESYWIMALFISLAHSFFEEYYWRAFILSELRGRISRTLWLCLIGGLLFGLHHIFALSSLFSLPIVTLCVLSIMVGGGIWSWMRLAGYSIGDCYISHVLADLSVMWLGYDLIVRA